MKQQEDFLPTARWVLSHFGADTPVYNENFIATYLYNIYKQGFEDAGLNREDKL